jgi:hypothetical protein
MPNREVVVDGDKDAIVKAAYETQEIGHRTVMEIFKIVKPQQIKLWYVRDWFKRNLSNERKDDIIKNVYFDTEVGFRGINETFRLVKGEGITMDYLRGWYDREVEKNKLEGKGKNSYVAQRPHQEYQWDFFYITDNMFVGQRFKYGLSVIDIFTKKADVIPCVKNDTEALIDGLDEAFVRLGGIPDVLYSDNDGAAGIKYEKFCENNKIKFIFARTHAHFVERFHRTFRGMLHKRMVFLLQDRIPKDKKERKELIKKVEKSGEAHIQWSDLVPEILKAYNNTKHSTIRMTPNEAEKPSNQMDVKAAIELKARFPRKYPEVKVGDVVRVVKKKAFGEKEHVGRFLTHRHTVTKIETSNGQKFYTVAGFDAHPLIRADIAIDKVETALFQNKFIGGVQPKAKAKAEPKAKAKAEPKAKAKAEPKAKASRVRR